MALGTEITTTTAANFIPQIWSKDTRTAVESNLVFAKRVNRQFESDLTVGNTINIQDISNLTVGNKTANVDVSFEAITEANTAVSINKWKYAAFKLEDIVKVQSNVDLMAKYTEKIGYGLAKQIDSDVSGLYTDLGQTVGTQGSAVTDANILRSIQYIDDADAPSGDRSWVIKPAAMSNVLALAKFVQTDAVGYLMQMSPIVTATLADGNFEPAMVKGYFGQIYGVSVYISSNVTSSGTSPITYHNLMFHRDAFILVMQEDIRVQTDYNIRSLSQEVVGDCIYGVKTYRSTFACDFLT